MTNRNDVDLATRREKCLTWCNASSPFVHHLHQHLEQTTTWATSLNFTFIPCALLQKPQYILKLLDPIRFSEPKQISTFPRFDLHLLHHQRPLSKVSSIDLALSILHTRASCYQLIAAANQPHRDSDQKWPSCCRASSTMELRCTFPVGTCGRNMVTPKDSGNSSDSHIHGKVLLDSAKWLKTILRFNTNKNHIAQPVQKYSMTQVGTSGLQHQPWVLVHLETKVDLKAFHGSHDVLFQPAKTLQLLCPLRLNFLGFGQIKPYCCASGINTMLANVRWGSKQHGCYQVDYARYLPVFFHVATWESRWPFQPSSFWRRSCVFWENAITFGGSANIRWFPRMHRAELEDNANHDMMMQTLKVIWR